MKRVLRETLTYGNPLHPGVPTNPSTFCTSLLVFFFSFTLKRDNSRESSQKAHSPFFGLVLFLFPRFPHGPPTLSSLFFPFNFPTPCHRSPWHCPRTTHLIINELVSPGSLLKAAGPHPFVPISPPKKPVQALSQSIVSPWHTNATWTTPCVSLKRERT